MPETPTEELVRRIEHLEAGYRWWKRTGIGSLAAVAGLLMLTAYTFSQGRREGQPQEQPLANPKFAVDTTSSATTYVNFCHYTTTPEELVLDFGLNIQKEPPTEPVKITNRLVMNFYTAKRLAGALHQAVQRYESQYGEVETDWNKRAKKK